jgi:hypothetical protein
VRAKLKAVAKKRARAPADGATWALEPHVCRHCFGRLASALVPDGRRRYHCTNCGAEALGDAPDVLCSCGLKLRNHGPGAGQVDAGLRCQPNPSPSPDFPSLFVAAEART